MSRVTHTQKNPSVDVIQNEGLAWLMLGGLSFGITMTNGLRQ